MGERLKDKVAIVTGAGSVLPGMGNGKATAIVFAREGAKVMAVDYNLEAAEETKKMIDGEGGECITFQADVSKAGVIALTREVAILYADKGIRCNAILPGMMKTPMVEYYNPDAYGDGSVELMWQRRDAMSPTGKQGEPWDVAYAALFLASDDSKYITGTTLRVDAGLSATQRSWPSEKK